MAFIQNEDEELQQGQTPGQGQAPLVGQGTNAVSQAASQGGVGAGGTGGWTNIQAYLNANKSDTGSAQALSNTVQGQFNQERDAFKTDADKFSQDAQKQVGDSKVTTDQAGQMIQQGAQEYDWGGQQKSSYSDGVNKIQNFLTGEYKGPTSYSYGFGADTQKYGTALKSGDGFDSVMNDVYSKSASRPLTSGQFQLQKQFDVNNENLANARTKLAGQYDQLGQERDQTVSDTTAKLQGFEQDYRTGQNALVDYLGNQKNQYQTKIDEAEGKAKTEYDKLFNTGKTGNASIGWGSIGETNAAKRASLGILGDDLAWSALERENAAIAPNDWRADADPNRVSWYDWNQGSGDTQRELDRRRGLLDSFYGEQDTKYQDTADPEERAYNTILDFLNAKDERKKQGFKVRG